MYVCMYVVNKLLSLSENKSISHPRIPLPQRPVVYIVVLCRDLFIQNQNYLFVIRYVEIVSYLLCISLRSSWAIRMLIRWCITHCPRLKYAGMCVCYQSHFIPRLCYEWNYMEKDQYQVGVT